VSPRVDLGLSGRTAAVAGASRGLGFGAARALVAEGVRVAICGRDGARLEAAAASLGTGCVGLVCDVSTPDGGGAFVEEAIAALGSVDILVANAGGPPAGTFASTDLDAYRAALDQNLLSTVAMCKVAMCKVAVPPMQQRGWGRVVAITSVFVRQPSPTLILSNTARTGVTGFLKTLAREVAGDGVTVNSLQPGLHATDRMRELGTDFEAAARSVPAGRVGDADDFGSLVALLCSEQANFVTGSAIPVDGGTYTGLQ
jgi:3-oxoacyl-[acyl-carrier protein] reductase